MARKRYSNSLECILKFEGGGIMAWIRCYFHLFLFLFGFFFLTSEYLPRFYSCYLCWKHYVFAIGLEIVFTQNIKLTMEFNLMQFFLIIYLYRQPADRKDGVIVSFKIFAEINSTIEALNNIAASHELSSYLVDENSLNISKLFF